MKETWNLLIVGKILPWNLVQIIGEERELKNWIRLMGNLVPLKFRHMISFSHETRPAVAACHRLISTPSGDRPQICPTACVLFASRPPGRTGLIRFISHQSP